MTVWHQHSWSRVAIAAIAVMTLGGLPSTPYAAASFAGPIGIDPRLAATLATAAPTDRLLVFVHARTSAEIRQALSAAGLTLVESFDRVAAAAAAGTAAQIRLVADQPGVTYVEPDTPITFSLDTSHRATRGEEARTVFQTVPALGTGHRPGQGGGSGNPQPGSGGGVGWGHIRPFQQAFPDEIDGRGVTVAVVDSGVDGTHPFFQRPDGRSKVVRNLKLACHDLTQIVTRESCGETGGDTPWVAAPGNDSDTVSTGGHGTHVAGIVAGVDTTLADGRALHGAAPGAELVALSVGQLLSIYGGASGLYWVLRHHADPCGGCTPIRVVNNSWGPLGGGDFSPSSIVAKIQEQLVAAGVVVVWANGNDGGDGGDNRSNPPAQTPTGGVLGVANYDDGNAGSRNRDLNGSSSRGRKGSLATYPDLSAPGTSIISSCRTTLPVCTNVGDWAELTGTSMAAPHVAGIVAQLLQVKPGATPAEIEDVLEDTAYKFGPAERYEADLAERNADDGTSYDAGHGLVDVVRAVARLLGLDPGSVPPPAAECASGTNMVVTDDAGDATTTLGLPNPEGNVPALDVLAASIVNDAVTPKLDFTIEVDDLRAEPPAGSTGEHFDFEFAYSGQSYFLSATNDRTSPTGPRFRLGQFRPTRVTLAELTGRFDPAADTVTIFLPYDTHGAIPVVEQGSVFGSFTITSRKVIDGFIPNVDSAGGACPYVVGTGVVEPAEAPEPAPTPPPVEPTPDATLTDGQTFERDGTSPADNANHSCSGPGDPRCVTYVLKLQPGDGTGTVSFALTATNPLDDFDIAIARWPSNEIVASSANPATIGEEGTVDLAAGTYFVVIQPFLAAKGAAFHVRVSLG